MEEQNKPLSADGWIEWKGGKPGDCPVYHSAMVQVRFRDGCEDEFIASSFSWQQYGWISDIVAYRLVGQEPAKAEPKQARARDSERAAFEAWLDITRPSGDCEVVQRAWLSSDAYMDWCDSEEERANPNAAMIARDGAAKPAVAAAPAAPIPQAHPPIPGLLIERDLNGQVSPRFGSASF